MLIIIFNILKETLIGTKIVHSHFVSSPRILLAHYLWSLLFEHDKDFILDALQQGASQFEQQAGKLKRKFWLQNLKVRRFFLRLCGSVQTNDVTHPQA